MAQFGQLPDAASNSSPPPRNAALAFVATTALFFAWGFITSNNDPLIAALRSIYHLNYTEALLTQFSFFAAYGLMSLPAAAILNRTGATNGVLVALGIMALACLMMMPATSLQTYPLVLAALFILAAGITMLQVAANPLAASLGAPERSHFRLTLAQAFNSLGVVIGVHFGSSIMLGSDVFEHGVEKITGPEQRAQALAAVDHAFLIIALFIAALMLFIWMLRATISAAQGNHVERAASNHSVFAAFKCRWSLLGAAAIFVYVGAEVAIGSVMINFLNAANTLALPLEIAGQYLANFYWGGALIGRFLGSWLLTRFPAARLLLLFAALAATLCLLVTLTRGPVAAYFALSIGMFNSIMFPAIFTLTLERSSVSQQSTSGLLCLAIVGGAFIPLLVGKISDLTSLFVAFSVPALAYVYVGWFALAAQKFQSR